MQWEYGSVSSMDTSIPVTKGSSHHGIKSLFAYSTGANNPMFTPLKG